MCVEGGGGGGGGGVYDLESKVTVMSADSDDQNFGPVYIMIPNIN